MEEENSLIVDGTENMAQNRYSTRDLSSVFEHFLTVINGIRACTAWARTKELSCFTAELAQIGLPCRCWAGAIVPAVYTAATQEEIALLTTAAANALQVDAQSVQAVASAVLLLREQGKDSFLSWVEEEQAHILSRLCVEDAFRCALHTAAMRWGEFGETMLFAGVLAEASALPRETDWLCCSLEQVLDFVEEEDPALFGQFIEKCEALSSFTEKTLPPVPQFEDVFIEYDDFRSGEQANMRLYHGCKPAGSSFCIWFSESAEFIRMNPETFAFLSVFFEEAVPDFDPCAPDLLLTPQMLECMRWRAAQVLGELVRKRKSEILFRYLRNGEPETLGLAKPRIALQGYAEALFAKKRSLLSLYRAFFWYVCEYMEGKQVHFSGI